MLHRHERLARTHVYLILTVKPDAALPLPAVEAALASEAVGMLQLRAPGADEDTLHAHVDALRPVCAAHDVLFLLNDEVALAAAWDLDGAHVGQEDMAPAAARALLGPERLLGLSTHDEAEIEAARREPVDHVGLGPCFPTASKTLAYTPGGADLVQRCVPVAGTLPVFPIGGIGPSNVEALAAVGSARAAIGAGILEAGDPAAAARACRDALRQAGSRPSA